MKMNCDIIQDLLTVYAAGECSQASEEAIKEHIAQCSSCAGVLRAMQEPIPAQQEEIDIQVSDFQMKKGLKKIRRRWFRSILCILMIFPLIAMGILIKNQVHGEGVCFSSLYEANEIKTFLRAVKKGNYNKAAEFLDMQCMFDEMTAVEQEDIYNYKNYTRITVGNEVFYIYDGAMQCYDEYNDGGNETDFWRDVMLYSYESGMTTVVPVNFFESAADEMRQMGIDVGQTENPWQLETVDDIFNFYTLTEIDEIGEKYMCNVYAAQLNENDVEAHASVYELYATVCVPEQAYKIVKQQGDEDSARISAGRQYYESIGFEQYCSKAEDIFRQNMKKLQSSGITFEIGKMLEAIKIGGS